MPLVMLFNLEEGAEYRFYVTVKCGNNASDRTPTYPQFYSFVAEDNPLLQLDAGDDLFAQELTYEGSNIYTNFSKTLQIDDNQGLKLWRAYNGLTDRYALYNNTVWGP